MSSDNFQWLAGTTALIVPIRHYNIVNTRLFGAVVAVDPWMSLPGRLQIPRCQQGEVWLILFGRAD